MLGVIVIEARYGTPPKPKPCFVGVGGVVPELDEVLLLLCLFMVLLRFSSVAVVVDIMFTAYMK